jgi:hypothetical protein
MASMPYHIVRTILIHLLVLSSLAMARPAAKPHQLTGVYFPSGCLSGRSFDGIVHYMDAAGLNLAVLHAKDPFGRLFWKSQNSMAKTMNASPPYASLEYAISILEQKGIWTAAKLDVFQDSSLVSHFPEMGVRDSQTG